MRYVPKSSKSQIGAARRKNAKPPQAGRLRYRPFLEALEDRWLPSGGLPSVWTISAPVLTMSNVALSSPLTSASFTAIGLDMTGAAQTPIVDQAVASITTDAGESTSDFSAGIDWGDGHSSDGTIMLGLA